MFGFTSPATAPGRRTSSAIAWIDRARAIVARTELDGAIGVDEIACESQEEDWHFLTRVADQIGDRDQVVIMGPAAMRISLEREYVTIYHRPDRIVDLEPARPVAPADLVDRPRRLT